MAQEIVGVPPSATSATMSFRKGSGAAAWASSTRRGRSASTDDPSPDNAAKAKLRRQALVGIDSVESNSGNAKEIS